MLVTIHRPYHFSDGHFVLFCDTTTMLLHFIIYFHDKSMIYRSVSAPRPRQLYLT